MGNGGPSPWRAEVLERVGVALLDRRAGKAEARGIRQDRADVGAEVFLLRPVRLVHHQDPVVRPVHRQFAQGGLPLALVLGLQALVVPVELEDGGEHHFADRAGRDGLAQLLDAARFDDVLNPDRRERLGDLRVEVDPVGEDKQVGVLQAWARDAAVGLELERGEHHREAFARALGVPDQPGAVLALDHALDHLAHGAVLLVAADLFDGLAVARFEHDEVRQDVEQPPRLQERVQASGGGVGELTGLARPRIAPAAPVFFGRACGPVLQVHIGRGDVEQVGVEEARHLALGGLHLVDGVGQLLAAVGGALGLDDDERDAVDVHDDIGLAHAPSALHAKLVRAGELVVLHVLEVDEPDGAVRGLAGDFAGVVAAQDLEPALVVGQPREVARDGAGGLLGDVVDADERRDQERREQHLVLALSQTRVGLWRDEAVAVRSGEGVQKGLLDQRVLVGRAHGETRTAPVRRSWRSPTLTCWSRLPVASESRRCRSTAQRARRFLPAPPKAV